MCHRIVPLTLEEVEGALARRAGGGRAAVSGAGAHQPKIDAYPRSRVPVIVPEDDGRLRAAVMTWGFTAHSRPAAPDGPAAREAHPTGKVIFNTRLDTALRQLRDGNGMWARAIAQGRCLIPVRAFYEQGRDPDGAAMPPGAPVTRPYRFTLVGSSIFLLAGVAEDGRFSIVTTEPNRAVAPIHNRMPLVLAPGESSRWLAGEFAPLADRSAVKLAVEPDVGSDSGQT